MSGDEYVYEYGLRDLLHTVQKLSKIRNPKKEPIKTEKEEIILKNRINLYKLENNYKNYLEELLDYLSEIENKNIDYEEIMKILNPDESKKIVDELTMSRIRRIYE